MTTVTNWLEAIPVGWAVAFALGDCLFAVLCLRAVRKRARRAHLMARLAAR